MTPAHILILWPLASLATIAVYACFGLRLHKVRQQPGGKVGERDQIEQFKHDGEQY